ncbi:hypothetical protein ABAC460_14350 [Asticcacaulis sp. AC460]|nr:hypothetical protein ABAC460_14350 [Asticcacaulis sp. AC460]
MAGVAALCFAATAGLGEAGLDFAGLAGDGIKAVDAAARPLRIVPMAFPSLRTRAGFITSARNLNGRAMWVSCQTNEHN